MSRTNISVKDDVHDRLDSLKRTGESFSELLDRAADALEGTETTGQDGECGPRVLTEENIDDIALRTADELENRMTRR